MNDNNKSLEIVTSLKKVIKTFRKNFESEFKEMNLTEPQGMLISFLYHTDEKRISDLSKRLGLSNSTVSGIVDRLEKRGIVERVRSNEDKRVVFVNITKEYKEKFLFKFKKAERNIEQMINKSSREDLDKILEGLKLLEKVISYEKDELEN